MNLQIFVSAITYLSEIRARTLPGSVAKNLAVLQNQWKASQLGYLYAINRSIMVTIQPTKIS